MIVRAEPDSAQAGADRLADLTRDVARHGEVEGLLAVEVPVHVGARHAGRLGDLRGQHVRAVLLDRLDRGRDDGRPAFAPVRVPARRAPVAGPRRAALSAAGRAARPGRHDVELNQMYV